MIPVTRLDDSEIALNCDLIESIESLSDTTIRLITGEILAVREPVQEVLGRIASWQAQVQRSNTLPDLAGARQDPAWELDESMVELFEG